MSEREKEIGGGALGGGGVKLFFLSQMLNSVVIHKSILHPGRHSVTGKQKIGQITIVDTKEALLFWCEWQCKIYNAYMSERERGREGDRQRQAGRHRETDRQTKTDKHRQTDDTANNLTFSAQSTSPVIPGRQTEGQTERKAEAESEFKGSCKVPVCKTSVGMVGR